MVQTTTVETLDAAINRRGCRMNPANLRRPAAAL
jgi:hypothetical protein